MENHNELIEKYSLLLPSAEDGGHLVIALYEKIKNQEIEEIFSITDIRQTLEEIRVFTNDPQQSRSERILKILLFYFLRNNTDDPGKYYLTEYARNVVELMRNKLENPYKNFPLKESFETAFKIDPAEIYEITDLEQKFGRVFIEGPKMVINNHLEALEDQLHDSYQELNQILDSDEKDATAKVRKFSTVFTKFGERAEDITNSIQSKDKFLKGLQKAVDQFYIRHQSFRQPETDQDILLLNQLKADWEAAKEINNDISSFFKTIDFKIRNINNQIFNASEKLSELQEHFSSRSHMKLRIKRLLTMALTAAEYDEEGARFKNSFPVKGTVYQTTRLFYPEYYDYSTNLPNYIVEIPYDPFYIQQQTAIIEKDIKGQERVATLTENALSLLASGQVIKLDELLDDILQQDKDFSVAYQVAGNILSYATESPDHVVDIEYKLISLTQENIGIWKTSLKKSRSTLS